MSLRTRGSRRRSALRWLLAFQLAAAAPVVGVGFVLDHRYEEQRIQETLRDGQTQAALYADLVFGPRLGGADLTTADPATVQAELSAVLADPAIHDAVARVKIWDRDGRVVASDDADLVGRTFDDDDERNEAFDGEVSAEVTSTVDDAEHSSERDLGRAVEVYTPLHAFGDSGRVIGVVEIYLPYAQLATELEHSSAALRQDLTVALCVLVPLLGAVTWPLVGRLRRQTRSAELAAVTDDTTGTGNRRQLGRWLASDLSGGRAGTLVLADISGLHRVNEALGVDGGDALIQAVARRLSTVDPGVRVARTGGGEFTVLLPRLAPQHLPARLEMMRGELAEPVTVAGVPVSPLVTLAAVRFPDQGADPHLLSQRADAALRQARRLPSGIACYDRHTDPFDAEGLRLLTELRSAVADGQLRLHYQPQRDVRSGRIRSVEALVRWQHPTRGLLLPGAFLPMAESSGLITEVTPWVLAEAARQQAAWAASGVHVDISVNISGRDLATPDFADRVLTDIAAAGGSPQHLVLELTETAVVADPELARTVLDDLHDAGLRISLDDFGQGATSLAQLRDLPLHEVKLDRAFVVGALSTAADRAIVRSVAALAHNLGFLIVAEGVETAEQAATLVEEGYDLLQGWAVGRPVPAEVLGPVLSPALARPAAPQRELVAATS